jgi:hypothetical protein
VVIRRAIPIEWNGTMAGRARSGTGEENIERNGQEKTSYPESGSRAKLSAAQVKDVTAQ